MLTVALRPLRVHPRHAEMYIPDRYEPAVAGSQAAKRSGGAAFGSSHGKCAERPKTGRTADGWTTGGSPPQGTEGPHNLCVMSTAAAASALKSRLLARPFGTTAAAASAMLLVACAHSGYQENTYPIAAGHYSHSEPIGHGAVGANTWTLVASQNAEGQLCMWMRWHPYAGLQDQGCGFGSNQVNDEGRGTEPIDTTETRDGTVLAYGPSPAGAVRVVLTSPPIDSQCRSSTVPRTVVTISHRMPDWLPPHGMGWFTTVVPAGALDCVIDARFVDAHGHTVAQPNDY
ncbi:hypothetical protein [uncultured Jatrophihabitans sp.]|uniref:hypothetical protein n=1 Tax=uncultured Jatrophihabitans sp. TaxID=1610747 RepID=UPI0035CAC34A